MCADQRRSTRLPLTIKVSYWVDDQERKDVYQVQSVNVGEGGVYLRTDLPLGLGTKVRLEFTLPGNNDTLQFLGEVVWAGKTQSGSREQLSGKGIKFTEMDNRFREQLRVLLTVEDESG